LKSDLEGKTPMVVNFVSTHGVTVEVMWMHGAKICNKMLSKAILHKDTRSQVVLIDTTGRKKV
jgi:hypothetical protein